MKPLTVGILGCGHIAPQHVHAWRRDPRFELRGVFDLDLEAARRRISDSRAAIIFESSERLIAECDVVDICTPPTTHFPLITTAVKAGKHVVVEKPVVIEEAEWRQIKTLLQNHKRSFSVVHHMKFTRLVATVKRWLEAGRLGRLLRIESFFATHPSVDRMLTEEPHWSHALPGGRWFETLPHNLYLIHYFAGPLAVDHVTAVSTPAAPAGVGADEVTITLKGPETLGTIHFSANCRHNYRWAVLLGTRGVLRLDLLSGALAFDRISDHRSTRASGRLFLQSLAALARSPFDRASFLFDRLARRTPHARFVETLGEHLFEGGPLPTPLDEISYTVENTYAIGKAIDDRLSVQ